MSDYAIINTRTGEPIRDHLGDPHTYEKRREAVDAADSYTEGNEDDFTVVPTSHLGEEGTRYLGLDLTDYAEEPPLEEQDDRYYNRTTILRELLPEEADIEVYSTGGYQGTMGYVIGLDGRFWLIKESYGSCSYCDGLLASDDSLEYGKSMLRNAYAFATEDDAREFLNAVDGWAWEKIKGEMADNLSEVVA